MKLIPLTHDFFTQIDDEDFIRVSEFTWTAHRQNNRFYAVRSVWMPDGSEVSYKLHAFLMGTPSGFHTHHIDGDGLNNQKSNLQVVSPAEHSRLFDRMRSDNKSGFRGVDFRKDTGKWRIQLCHNGRRINCSGYATAEDAALVRDDIARNLGWPEAGMNFPKSS